MNVDIRDPNAILTLRPLEVAAYLRAHGWTMTPVKSSKVSAWGLTDAAGDEFEVVVPLDQTLGDYVLRMGEMLHTLSAAEGRSQLQVYADLLTTFADVVRIRIDDPELQDGTMPIEVTAQVSQKARDLFLAAACSATENRAVWHTRKPSQAVEYVRNLRSGQTERGSYVFTVISRVSPGLSVLENGANFEQTVPYERVVIQKLAATLHELERAAEIAAVTGEFAAFDNSMDYGVSANLCDAVSGLWGTDDNSRRTLDFDFSWSPARPLEEKVPSHVKFTADRIPWIREAARVMRERAPVEDFELEGAVVKLDRPIGSVSGKVTIIGQVHGRPKRVTLELQDAEYHLAVEAHDNEYALRCYGTLQRQGRALVLQNPREVTLEF